MSDHPYTRQRNLKARLVQVTGHAGEPWYGVPVSRRYPHCGSQALDVVIVRPGNTTVPPRRVTTFSTYVKPLCPTRLPERLFLSLVDQLTAAGTLTRKERKMLCDTRHKLLHPTTLKRKNINKIDARVGSSPGAPRVGHLVGAGQVSREWKQANGFW